ncbi:hypothetical protein [Vibrio sp. EA2]|uniref:hypothetical protein n=1 Tax=Vibrio sp. EA2 TaxID=3079860 RepID=UPI00294A6F2A|nr:hypothetical protein [Vibrio sp. EA2]MDV6249770.1 hypothetical protein [Vibrio sp. EA2]
MENEQAYNSTVIDVSTRKMQRIIDKLRSEIAAKQHTSVESVVALTRESQLRLMNYKELYLHRESIGDDELKALYKNMSEIEKVIADEGVQTLTYMIQALDESW